MSELTDTLQASAATVRRDLELLEQQKLLSRTHGGAVGNGTLYELPVRYRGGQHASEKRRIADAAVAPDRRRPHRGPDRRDDDNRGRPPASQPRADRRHERGEHRFGARRLTDDPPRGHGRSRPSRSPTS